MGGLPEAFPSCFPSNDSWENVTSQGSALVCTAQVDFCAHINATLNGETDQSSLSHSTSPSCEITECIFGGTAYCPAKSHCANVGPGLVDCACNEGQFGYQCLKSVYPPPQTTTRFKRGAH